MKGAMLLIAALLGATPLAAQDAQAIIGRAARVYRSLSSLQADFVQVIDNPMIDSAESWGGYRHRRSARLGLHAEYRTRPGRSHGGAERRAGVWL